MRKLDSFQEKFREKLTLLLDDMRGHYTYVPDLERDITDFMWLYLNNHPENRAEILENLRLCIQGEAYPNPWAGTYKYGEAQVDECGRIVDEYLQELDECQGDEAAIQNAVRKVCEQVNILNEKCGHYLIDTWRREQLCGIIDGAAEMAGAQPQQDRTQEYRMW